MVKPGAAGYSTMAVLPDGSVGTLYEIGDTGGIVFARFTGLVHAGRRRPALRGLRRPATRYVRRYRPDGERCIGLAWCSACRTYAGAMVHVPREEEPPDPLAPLDEFDRERLLNSEAKLIDHIDRLIRRDAWPF